jgi:hypothetical protein
MISVLQERKLVAPPRLLDHHGVHGFPAQGRERRRKYWSYNEAISSSA